jgi:hypothetical protein
VLEGRWRGGSTVTAPVPSSPVFAYKNKGMESKKKKGAQGKYWPKLQKQTKNLFYLSFSIRGTALHVMRILDSKFFFWDAKTVRFLPH